MNFNASLQGIVLNLLSFFGEIVHVFWTDWRTVLYIFKRY